MSYPRLTQDGDLLGFPGAPFPTATVIAVEASIRGDASWHIAPQFRESKSIRPESGRRLALPTLKLVTLHSVTDGTGATVDPTTYLVDGTVLLGMGPFFWDLTQTYVVDMTHGYESADDLLLTVAARCQRAMTDATLTQRSETVGQRTASESYNVARIDDSTGGTSPVDRYRIHAF